MALIRMKVYPYVHLQGRLDREPRIPLTRPPHDDDEPWPQLLPPRFPSSTHPPTRGEDVGAEDGGGAAAEVAEDGAVVEGEEAEAAEEAVVVVVVEEVAEPLLLPERVM